MCVIFRRTGSGVSRGLGLDSGLRSGPRVLIWALLALVRRASGCGRTRSRSPNRTVIASLYDALDY